MRYRPEQIAPAVDRMLGQQLAGLVAKLGAAAPSSAGPNPAKPEAGKALPVKMDPARVGPGKPDITMPPPRTLPRTRPSGESGGGQATDR
jgi:hypothetical protein